MFVKHGPTINNARRIFQPTRHSSPIHHQDTLLSECDESDSRWNRKRIKSHTYHPDRLVNVVHMNSCDPGQHLVENSTRQTDIKAMDPLLVWAGEGNIHCMDAKLAGVQQ